MKNTAKRIATLILVLLMAASLLASCGNGEKEIVTEVDGIPVFDKYKSREVDLGLAQNETVFDIVEVDGALRTTIGVLESAYSPFVYSGAPYMTEHRWYSMDYAEDTAKREKTTATQEIVLASDTAIDLVFGGEPIEKDGAKGLQCFFYRDGAPISEEVVPPYGIGIREPDVRARMVSFYSPLAHVMVYEDVIYAAINSGTDNDGVTCWGGSSNDLYINGQFLDTQMWRPDLPDYYFCGLIGIKGEPYALLEIEEKGMLVPLSPDMDELTFDGTEIEGTPTGGAFSDGRYGYFLCGSEIWRTDGKKSVCIADLVSYGVTETSGLRAVRALSDGRVLVAIDGKLIELSGTEGAGTVTESLTIGVVGYSGPIDDLNLLVSKYNDSSEKWYFQVKKYDDVSDLNLSILSGEIAMVITPNRFTLDHYVKQNLLASLEEAAPTLFGKDVLIENIVDATRINGTCYYLPRYFTIGGENITNPSLLQDGKLFAMRKEYCDFIIQNDPDYFNKKTAADIFEVFARDLDEWVDWDTNTCHFDDGTLEEILEFCGWGSTQEEVDQYINMHTSSASQFPRNWIAGSFELHDTVEGYRFTDVKKAQAYQASLPKEGELEWVQVDFPMPSGVHKGFEIVAGNLYAVVDREESRAAAGDLLTWFILEDVAGDFTTLANGISLGMSELSINKDETDRCLRRLAELETETAAIAEEGSSHTISKDNFNTLLLIQNSQCGEEQYEITWDYIRSADHFRYTGNEIFDVMREEAGRYFAGSITAKQAADYIQNRVSLYLAEQS
ncbi:MAG: hypothetical protein IJF34_08445 [Clostridia bacterium]|nr:hypothetical protein [Clostridia bacterium]